MTSITVDHVSFSRKVVVYLPSLAGFPVVSSSSVMLVVFFDVSSSSVVLVAFFTVSFSSVVPVVFPAVVSFFSVVLMFFDVSSSSVVPAASSVVFVLSHLRLVTCRSMVVQVVNNHAQAPKLLVFIGHS